MVEASRADSLNMGIVGHHDLAGSGDGMHVNVVDGIAYVGHMGETRVGTSILDVSDPRKPELLTQIETPPGTHSHKVQVVDDLLVVNYERNAREPDANTWQAGMQTFDVSDPSQPVALGFLPTPGKGVHRVTFWEAPYVLMSASQNGFSDQILLIADVSDPSQPAEVGRWWVPGMHTSAGEIPSWDTSTAVYKAHHGIIRGNRAFVSWWDAGFVVLDISDIRSPRLVSHTSPDTPTSQTHTTLPVPGKDLLVVGEEATKDRCLELDRNIFLYDISDDRAPTLISTFPRPSHDFCSKGGRFGPHNIHEGRPGALIDPDTVYVTYFNAGVRVFDISKPENPVERGYCVPEPPPGRPAIQMNDLTVTTDGLIYATDRFTGGLYVMEYTG
ncbi:MAG TPA: hypothetical protein VMS74_10020 [Acidimicrobiia bacterium]|nr:hypothetical protein [Acidimicrobiia bacterium]